MQGEREQGWLQPAKFTPSAIPLEPDFNRHSKQRALLLAFACVEEKPKGINNSFQTSARVIRHVGSEAPCALAGWPVTNLVLVHTL